MTTSENTAGTAPQPPHYLDGHAMARPDKIAVACGDDSLTYAQLNARARRVANALRELGVQANDRVVVMAYNSIELLEIVGGLSKLSAISVLTNYRLRPGELAYIVNDCQASAVLVGPGLVGIADQARPDVQGQIPFIAIGDELPFCWLRYEDLLANASEEIVTGEGGLGSTMSYTSGTTGKPKGAYRPKSVPVPDIIQIIQAFELTEPDVHLLAGPYYHSAPSFFVSLHLLLGSTIVVQPRFDAEEALRLIQRHKVTTTFLPPVLLQRLCDLPEEVFARSDFSSLRTIILGGAPCPTR